MADVQHRDAAIAQAPHVREQPLDFRCRQCGGGLVEHEHAAVARQCRRDLDQLPLPDAERRNGRARIQCLEAHQRQRLSRARMQRRAIEEPESTRQSREEQVLRDAERLDQVEFLQHHLHARVLGGATRPWRMRLPRQRHRAAVGCRQAADDAHQRRLAGAVGAHQRVHLAGAEVEVDAGEHRHRVRLAHSSQGEQRGRGVIGQ